MGTPAFVTDRDEVIAVAGIGKRNISIVALRPLRKALWTSAQQKLKNGDND